MKRNGKAMLIMALMVLGGGAKGAAIEREGEILFETEYFGFNYALDLDGDMIDDCEMGLSFMTMPMDVFNRLSRYLNAGTRIIYEDEGLKPHEGFGAGRMIGFIGPNGQFVRLDQMFSQEVIKKYFPDLWAKIQAEQRASR